MRSLLLALVAAAAAHVVAREPAPDGAWFEDITARAGVAAPHHTRTFTHQFAGVMAGYTALGAAAAVADYDGDGWMDVFTTDSSETGRNHLFHNNHDLTFTDVAERAGVASGNDASNASADAVWFDYDNDERLDLFVVRFGRSQLFHNDGNGHFTDVTARAGLDRYSNAITAIAFDYDRDGNVDLFVGSYFSPVNVFDPKTPRFFPESFETANNGGGITAYRNRGDGTFVDVTDRIGLTTHGWTLDLGHADADNDGDEDLYAAVDFGTDRFFRNNGDGTFTDITESAIGIDTRKGMNAEWADVDGDNLVDLFCTNITTEYMREGNFLWHNNGNLTFTDVAREMGVYDSGWGWGGQFVDVDNDSWLDLFTVNGWVSAGPESYVPDIFAMLTQPNVDFADVRNWPPMGSKSLSGYEHDRLFHNEHGRAFTDVAARHGVDSTRDGRGVAVADFDNDGRSDVFVTNANAAPYLYHNVAPRRHWIDVDLRRRSGGNRFAVGAQARATIDGRTLLRFVNGGNGFAGQSTMRLHFGLDVATHVDRLDIRWPDGTRQLLENLPADRTYTILQGSPETTQSPSGGRHER